MNLWCIHGNLQQPSVWQPFDGCWRIQLADKSEKPLPLQRVNLWDTAAHSLESWAQSFCDEVSLKSDGLPQWLMGYSLGGRLALHALIERPKLWAGVIAIAAHPGLTTRTEKKVQLMKDLAWGNRFLTAPWDELMAAWDALPVFGGFPNPLPRDESTYNRSKIAYLFDIYSKGRQENLQSKLTQLSPTNLLLMTGERDQKYRRINNQLQKHCPSAQHITISNACHRVPWEATDAFKKAVQQFLYRHAQIT